jgi:hypothetical protein
MRFGNCDHENGHNSQSREAWKATEVRCLAAKRLSHPGRAAGAADRGRAVWIYSALRRPAMRLKTRMISATTSRR